MKRISKQALLSILLFLLAISMSSVSYAEVAYENWNEEVVEVLDNKEWTIEFNQFIELDTAYDNIFVVKDSTSEKIAIDLNYTLHGKGIKVSPLGKYESGETYTLYIRDGIESLLSKKLNKNIKLDFKILDKAEKQLEVINVSAPEKDIILLTFNMPLDEDKGYGADYRIIINGYEFGKEGNEGLHSMHHSDGSVSGLTLQRDIWSEGEVGFLEFTLNKKYHLKSGDKIQVKIFKGDMVSEDGSSYIDDYNSEVLVY